MFTKLLIAPAVVVLGAEVLKGGAEAIILAGAALGALGYIFRLIRRSARRGGDFMQRVHHGVDLLEQLPPWQREVEEHLNNIDRRFDVMADAEQLRIRDALTGDPRSPVDRRAA